MSNKLIGETSPYLLQHAQNPVDWYPWGEEALQKAHQENKPIFLSIGYSACHWCHVMAHESFENKEVAKILNLYYISIKVDREERPDLDSIYMAAVVSLTGQGGWPMSVFLTPEGEPFYGGTYFPPIRRYGMPSFTEVLISIAKLWENSEQDIFDIGKRVTESLGKSFQWELNSEEMINKDDLNKATEHLIESYDWENGGWGPAPKFPAPMIIEFMLLQALRGNQPAADVASHALKSMNRGGIFDILGGGFHRYSTDSSWKVPHFEKMLYDNAQLALTYLHAYLMNNDKDFLKTCTQTLDFITKEMTAVSGGFYSSLDADFDGEEGRFYTWQTPEFTNALNDNGEIDFIKNVYKISGKGNIEGRFVLQRSPGDTDEELARKMSLSTEEFRSKLENCHKKLYYYRSQRNRPAMDDKVLVFWNALTLRVFAEAARYLNDPRYLKVAQKNAQFQLNNFYSTGTLLRSWRNGRSHQNAFLEDYASLIIALLALYQADFNNRWYQAAYQLAKDMIKNFSDPAGGFYETRNDHEELLIRPMEIQDNATPSGNSMAAYALLHLAEYSNKKEWRDKAEKVVGNIQKLYIQHPSSFSFWLQVADFALGPINQIAIITPDESENQAAPFINRINNSFRPGVIMAYSKYPPEEGSPVLVKNRHPIPNKTTIFVCRNFYCRLPITGIDELDFQLTN